MLLGTPRQVMDYEQASMHSCTRDSRLDITLAIARRVDACQTTEEKMGGGKDGKSEDLKVRRPTEGIWLQTMSIGEQCREMHA